MLSFLRGTNSLSGRVACTTPIGLEEIAKLPDEQLVDGHRSIILNPHDPVVIAEAQKNGISDGVLEAAQNSPVYRFVVEWKIALPPHIEYRTLPMLFYVPPMSPVQASKPEDTIHHETDNLFHDIDSSRVPLKFLANLFGAGYEGVVRYALGQAKSGSLASPGGNGGRRRSRHGGSHAPRSRLYAGGSRGDLSIDGTVHV